MAHAWETFEYPKRKKAKVMRGLDYDDTTKHNIKWTIGLVIIFMVLLYLFFANYKEKPTPVVDEDIVVVEPPPPNMGNVLAMAPEGENCYITVEGAAQPVLTYGKCPLFFNGDTAFSKTEVSSEDKQLHNWLCLNKVGFCILVR